MANISLARLPGTLKRYAARICDYENDTSNDNGHWVHLANGWKNSDDPMGVSHIIHEMTLAQCATAARDALPCDCVECVKGLANPKSADAALKK
jgi:hypothetical protein